MRILFQQKRAKYSGQAKGPEKKVKTSRQSGLSYWNGWGSRVLAQKPNIITQEYNTEMGEIINSKEVLQAWMRKSKTVGLSKRST